MDSTTRFFFTENSKLKDISDEELVKLIKQNNNKEALEYLLDKYKDLVNMKVGKYFIIGAEREDMIQEGMIGLYKAVQNFEGDKQSSFKSFANMCIERQMITAIKTSNRQKHMPLNGYLSLNSSAGEEEDDGKDLMEIFNANLIEDPLETITKKEYYKNIENTIDKSLSEFEKQVLKRFINGESYEQIATKLDTQAKSVDNAIQRIRKKAIRNIIDVEENV
ncbi:MAG: RNA polymerase sporulation sigma factor SigH [Clostridia bacterium]|nr:RNA polymerase sporulation sigma factor SigH [Clostridia bacterium]MCI8961309.1 RNA polymerase sporulation sigma factor SigH [Clostridia bacterium]